MNNNNFDKSIQGSYNEYSRNFDTNYRFVLRKYAGSGSKLQCPRCGRKSFTPYIDTQTNEILDETVGICDHKNSCCYHFSPKEYFEMFPHKKEEYFVRTRTGNSPVGNAGLSAKNKAINTGVKHQQISVKHYQNTLNNQQDSASSNPLSEQINRYALFASAARTGSHPRAGSTKKPCAGNAKNYIIPKEIIKNKENGFNFTSHNLEIYMIEHFGRGAYDDIYNMFQRMIVKGDFEGGTLFYQIDLNGDIRTAKIIRYNASTGHRRKEKGANWLHSVIIKQIQNGTLRAAINENLSDFTLRQVPFGLWQLKMRKDKVFNTAKPLPICIYEAEKTACFMDFLSHDRGVHLALGGYDYLKTDMLLPLVEAGVRRACLFPDKGCFSGWCEKADKIMSELPIELVVSDILEQTPLPDGSDIADIV